MAEPVVGAGPYGALVRSRWRSQTAYRRSLTLDIGASALVGLVELAEILVIFANVDTLGGLNRAAAILVFGIAATAFSVAELLVGHLDVLPTYVRTGTLDAFLLRPLSVLGQLATADLSLRRFGRAAVGVVVLVGAATQVPVEWGIGQVALLLVTVVSGTAIFGAVFVWSAAIQFWLVEGGEFVNAFTYGGSYAAQYPASVFAAPLRLLFTFVIPATFVGYLPVLALLGLPGPAGLPSWLGFTSPLAAAAAWVAALLTWRAGLRHYTGAGS